VMVMVPVAVVHVVWVRETVGAAGVAGCAFIVAVVPVEVQPAAFLAVTVYVFGSTRVNTPVVLVYVTPSMLYVIPAPVGAVIVIVPVAVAHVVCVRETVGAPGIAGCAFIVAVVPVEVQPAAFLAVTVYVFGLTRVNTPVVLVYVTPSMLYVIPAPVGAVMVIVPVAEAHVVWVRETVGAAGVAGCAFIVAVVPGEVQPAAFLAVTVYVFGLTRVNMPVVLVYVTPSILYVIPAPVGAVIVIVPVAVAHVVCVRETVGAAGVAGCAFIVAVVPVEVQPAAFLAVTVYVFGLTRVNTPVVLVYVTPSMLYVIPAPVGAVMVIVPVAVAHVVCVRETVGAAGVAGCTFIVAVVPVEVQPAAFLAVTV
jgi:hypothetical protein